MYTIEGMNNASQLTYFYRRFTEQCKWFCEQSRLVTSMYVGLSLHTHDRTLINRISQGVFCVLEDHPTVNKIWIILVLTDTRTTRTR